MLLLNTEISGTTTTVSFDGSLDEDADLTKIQYGHPSTLILDCEKITALNSCGVREWLKLIGSIPQNTKLVYRKCPRKIVEQMNLIRGFIPKGAQVESFYVPYYCESCKLQTEIVKAPGDFPGKKVLRIPCPKCGKQTEPDFSPEKYLLFFSEL